MFTPYYFGSLELEKSTFYNMRVNLFKLYLMSEYKNNKPY